MENAHFSKCRKLTEFFSPVSHWRMFSGLIVVLFLSRGVFQIGVTPTLEGWDEYQHLAYLEYLHQHGEAPILGEASVSRDLLRESLKLPQPQNMLQQTSATGAVGYNDYWNNGPPQWNSDHPDIGLYQAQHGAFYYWTALPIFRLCGGIENLLSTIAILRLLNLVWGAATLSIFLWVLGKIILDLRVAGFIAIIIGVQPLYLQNVTRVANDPLSILLGTIVIAWALQPVTSYRWWHSIIAGIALGCAAWSKGTCLALFPFVVFSSCLKVWFQPNDWRKEIRSGLAVIVIGMLFVGPQLLHSYERFGTLTPMQEAVHNHSKGLGTHEIISTGFDSSSLESLMHLWLKWSVHAGGWSFQKIPKPFGHLFMAISVLALIGWSWKLLHLQFNKSSENAYFKQPVIPFQFFSLIACMSLALMWHIIQSQAAWGVSTTNPWYTCLGMPFALTLTIVGGMQWGRIAGLTIVSVIFLLLSFANVAGYANSIPYYTGTAQFTVVLSRLSSFQPVWLGTPAISCACLIAILTSTFCLSSAVKSIVSTTHENQFRTMTRVAVSSHQRAA